MSKEAVLAISLVLIIIIGLVVYDYQIRKIFAETMKRIATMGTLKKVVKSPITAMAFIWGVIWGNERD